MNGPQQSTEKVPLLGTAPSNAEGDPGNRPGRGGNRGGQCDGSQNNSNWPRKSMQYNSQPRMPDRRYSGSYRGWNNRYFERNSPYQRNYKSNYRNREQYDDYNDNYNHNSHPDRQERDYPKRTDYHYSSNSKNERSPSKYRDNRYREQRYNLRQSEDNYHRDSLRNEINFHRQNSHRQEPSENNKASKADSVPVLDRSKDISEPESSNAALKEQSAVLEKAERLEKASKSGSTPTRASKAEKKNTSPVEKPSSHKPNDQNHNLTSGSSPPTKPTSKIQVRPLTELLKQEILAVTKEKSLNRGQPDRQTPTSPAPAIASPSRQAIKPNLKNRRRTVSCHQSAIHPSRSEQEVSINERIARLDKESLKYIINNSDTVYDEHLKLQARRRLRDEIRRQLRAIELDQPKDNPVKDLVEDEIVDAIKLPEQLLQEIEKCFGINISENHKVVKSSREIQKVAELKEICTKIISEKTAEEVVSPLDAGKDESQKSSKDLINDTNVKGFSNKTTNQSEPIKSSQVSTKLLKDHNKGLNIEKEDTDQNKIVETSKTIKEQNDQNIAISKAKDLGITEKKDEKPLINAASTSIGRGHICEKDSQPMSPNKDLPENILGLETSRKHPKSSKVAEVIAEKRRLPLLPTPGCGLVSNSSFVESQLTQSTSLLPTQNSQEIIEIVETSPETSLNSISDHMFLSDVQHSHMSCKRESSSSPIIEVRMPEDLVDLLSSDDDVVEAVDMEVDESEGEIVESEFAELREPTPPASSQDNSEAGMELDKPEDEVIESHINYDENVSTDPQGITEYEKNRLKLKLQSMADNVVDSFEKLILPNLRESLSESYSRKHSTSLQSRLHFISCVVTSSEHNSRTFSKIEVAKIQKNLKAADNQLAMEFLIGEIVNVINMQKQRLRGQGENNQENLSRRPESEAKETGKASHINNSPEYRITSALNPRSSPPPLVPILNPGFPSIHPSITPYPVGLPFLATDSSLHRIASNTPASFGYPQPGATIDSMDLSDQVGQINEIDRRLLENQNRRTFLDEMIMKFQKERSDLELLSLELQTRRSMLLNSILARSRPPMEAPPAPEIPPHSPPRPSKRKPPKRLTARSAIARRTRSQTQKPIRVRKVQMKRISKSKAKELKAKSSKEIPEEAKKNQPGKSKEPQPPDEPNIKGRLEESSPKKTVDNLPTTKSKQSRAKKPKANGASNVAQPPLAIIPPLPPPPPPPEPIHRLSFERPNLYNPPPTANYPRPNPRINNLKIGNIPKGKLHDITSPITQIRIYKKYAIAASEDGDIYVFHLVTHKLERKIPKHSEAITNMFLCEQEALLYTTSVDGFLKKSAVDNLERVLQTTYFKEPLQSIDVAWGAAFIGSRWGKIFSYNVVTNKIIDNPLLSTGQSIIAVKATKEGIRKILLIGCKGNFVLMHDAGSGLLLRQFEIPEGLNVYSILLDDNYLYCGTQKNEIFQFEFVTGILTGKFKCGNGAVSIASYEDRYLLVGCYDGFIYVLDKVAGKGVGSFKGAGRLILSLIVAGDKIVTSSKDNNLEILEIPKHMVN
ncbi:zinc finger protein 106 [Drosophila bipectinata]|uniref:zinc finger protein 106 n=1 Tax=Drosophila bipectinata TaxID=42026 RepID=UPI0038B2FF50